MFIFIAFKTTVLQIFSEDMHPSSHKSSQILDDACGNPFEDIHCNQVGNGRASYQLCCAVVLPSRGRDRKYNQ